MARRERLSTQEPHSAAWHRSFRGRLLRWYAHHARDLPWRASHDPYRVWISEVMLQQTQVETVKAYFERFTAAFPTVHQLAAAEEQDVLRLWEGLGYYRRARGLHAAAKQIVAEHGGRLPATVDELMQLPGIGRYTAGAIVSIAYDRPAPILEANTIRLFTRLVALAEDPTKSAGQQRLWSIAEQLLPQKNSAHFNQALMELGSLVCTPKKPACDICPVATLCQAHQRGCVETLKPTTKKLKFTEAHEAAVVVRNGTRVLLRQCAQDERWAGLWDFPRFAIDSEGPQFAAEELRGKVSDLTGVDCQPGALLKTIKHGVTRFRITLDCYEALRVGGRLREAKWVAVSELANYPLSVTGRKISKLLESR